jgi:protein-S-isoprenylcysteine O-methyltransferase Ste14
MGVTEVVVLVISTIAIAVFSWQFSIKARRFHGVYRFFSFESILVLTLLNWRFWFFEPFSWNQIVSWFALIGSIPLVVEGFRLLRIVGKPQGQLENTTRLVRVGVYRYIRHPLYASLILLGCGVYLKHLTWYGLLFALVNLAALIATAKTEEKEMILGFGAEYETYMKQTRMFFPEISGLLRSDS